MLRSLIIVCLIITAFISFNLGMDWINFGHGLHPAIALPIATITFIGAFIVHKFVD